MEYRKSHKRRLTKFGKIFFCFTIILMIGFLSLYVNNSNRNLFGKGKTDNYKEEANNYLIEINYE